MSRLITAFGLAAALSCAAHAQSLEQVRAEVARAVYASAGPDINHAAPQPLLRAVVVLRVRLGENGRWNAEVMRENHDEPALTRRAIASVEALDAPPEPPEPLRAALRREGFVEAWLFQTDGHFALKTLALPQRGL